MKKQQQQIHLVTMPEWLIKLPMGNWSTQDIEQKTGQSRVNISLKLKRLGVKFEKKQNCITGRWENIYYWKGAEFYLKKNLKEIFDK